jgi:hypothetical protein
LAEATDYPALTLVNGLPDAGSMVAHFTAVPMVQERADFQERTEDSAQGQLHSVSIRANTHRDSTFYSLFANKKVIAYVETANGEMYLWGSDAYPMSYDYERDSGAGNSDDRFTTLRMSMTAPIL